MKLLEEAQKTEVQFAVLFATLVLYLIVKNVDPGFGVVLGIFIAIEIFVMVGLEIRSGAHEYGWKHEVIDTIVALVIAVAIWISASVMLNTSSPISGVVSCSMLPNLYRGDFVIIQGAPVDAYTIEMSEQELAALQSHEVTIHTQNGTNASVSGSAYSYCMYHRYEDVCKTFISEPEQVEEIAGPFTYRYAECQIDYPDNVRSFGPCLRAIEFEGREYLTNYSNSVIVYKSDPGTLYANVGDIVHRVFFRINVGNETYYVTRGDNNPILDIQVYDYFHNMGNAPIPERNVKGKVLFRIPILGYFKLFIAGFYEEDSQCKTQLLYDNVK